MAHVGVYPGTFDPATNGHMDIITRATHVVDELIVAIAGNVGKGPLFNLSERISMLEEEITNLDSAVSDKIRVVSFDTLLVDFVKEQQAQVIIRGLRAVSDFEYEFQMAGMNNRLDSSIETVFLMASDRNQFISSRFVKEIGRLGGDVTHFVSRKVAEKLAKRFSELGGV